MIKRFLNAAEASALLLLVEQTYALLENTAIRDRDLAKNFNEWDGVQLVGLPHFLRTHAPSLEPPVLEICSAIGRRLSRRFRLPSGRGCYFLPERSYFRRHKGTSEYVPWHIDADAAALAADIEAVNVWVPLNKVGTDIPSLEFMPNSNIIMRKVPLMQPAAAFRSDEWVRAHIPGRSWVPKAALGDAVIFDHYTLHRTQQVAAPKAVRLSCEFRFQLS